MTNEKEKQPIDIQMIISGVGGQGVLLATRILSEAAIAAGLSVIGSEVHGMSQRGGSVISHLKIGKFESPLVKLGSADILFSLERTEAYRTLCFVRPATSSHKGGLCFINAPDREYMDNRIKAYLKEKGIEVHVFGADRVAGEMKSIRSANIALIGFASAHADFPLSNAQLRGVIEQITPQKLRDLNLKIFEEGIVEGQRTFAREGSRSHRMPTRAPLP